VKRIGGLFDLLYQRSNLSLAAWSAAKGKRNRPEVRRFFSAIDSQLNRMSADLQRQAYRFSPYRQFAIRDPKSRIIHAPSFRDRVLHHAIINVAGRVFERGAIEHSYACRQGKGLHAALRQARSWTRRTLWYGKMDVRRYYDSIDHQVMLGLLAGRFREQRLLRLFADVLDSHHQSPGKGLPIGALTSQYLANFLLDTVDHAVMQTGLARHYLRYMDDMIVWCDDPAALLQLRTQVARQLATLGLRLKHGGEWNRCSQGVPMLGFVVYPDRVRLGKQGRKRLRRKLRAVRQGEVSGKLDPIQAQQQLTSVFAHAAWSDDHAWRRSVLAVHAWGERPE